MTATLLTLALLTGAASAQSLPDGTVGQQRTFYDSFGGTPDGRRPTPAARSRTTMHEAR
ncbi:hypothetical protein HAP41_0000011710 [Bradyrhizobium barranii subsp. apii]|uniref:Uncharacterized protein n=1 Tax=Bradyrhizobium barranii subsp. apii TaxID=2819348 RepID=A0A8U0FPK1_9BRAD|nr:hypothetical protein [Bradyrhizobium barranii]UPT89576.1 hypothetical protein HAP41_0000011710 [Bradyrhizobium barranii subsp. apii]